MRAGAWACVFCAGLVARCLGGVGAALTDHPVGQCVEVEQVDADVRRLDEGGQDLRDEPAGRTHLVDLGGGAELDGHATSVATRTAPDPVTSCSPDIHVGAPQRA